MTIRANFDTAGEQLVRRELQSEMRLGVEHYVIGQHGTFTDDGLTFLTYVNAMGHAVAIPLLEDGTPLGVAQSAGHVHVYGIKPLPQDFELSDAMKRAIEEAKGEG
jgi:hypothetical protein